MDNPFIPSSNDPFEGYNESIKENFGKGKTHDYQALCYKLFNEGDGAKWLEMASKDVNGQFTDLSLTNAHLYMASLEGARFFLKHLELMVLNHKQFLQSEAQ